MDLTKSLHSIWEGRGFLSHKGKFLVSLAAIGVLGGFFVTQVWANEFQVTSPIGENIIWGGKHNITWNPNGKCVEGDKVGIVIISSGAYITTSTDCMTGSFEWDTSGQADGAGYQLRVGTFSFLDESDVFTIDNTAPAIAASTIVNPTTVLAGTIAQPIVWNTGNISDNFTPGNDILVRLYYSTDGANYTEITSPNAMTNSGSFSWTPSTINSSNVTLKIRAIDQAGNFSEQTSGVFAIDSTRPTVSTISVNDNTIIVSDALPSKIVTVVYSEAMATTAPTISFHEGYVSTPIAAGVWSEDKTTWTQTFSFTDGINDDGADISVNGGVDDAGNVQTATGTLPDAFAIDTMNPTVGNVTVVASNSATSNGGFASAGMTVNVAIDFSEAMDTTATQTVNASVTEGSVTTNYPVLGGAWTANNTKWSGSFTVVSDSANGEVKIAVSGATDATGNEMALVTDRASGVVIDTAKPIVDSLTVSNSNVHDGAQDQTVTVTFSEPIWNPNATIEFVGASVTSYTEGLWTLDNTVYTKTFSLADLNVEVPAVSMKVYGQLDLSGNQQVAFEKADAFALDTLNPAIVSLTNGHDDLMVKDSDTVVITAIFSQAVESAGIKIGSTNGVMDLAADKSSATYSWNVPAGIDADASVEIEVFDNAGNKNSSTPVLIYTVDNLAPTMETITPSEGSFLSGNGDHATLVFDFNDVHLKDLELDIYRPGDTLEQRLQPTLPADSSVVQGYSATLLATYGVKSASYDSTAQKWTIVLDTQSPVWRDGLTRFYIEVEDIAGNKWGNMMAPDDDHMWAWIIDNAAPVIETVTSPVAGAFYKENQAYVNFTGSDTAGAISCSYKVGSNNPVYVSCGSAELMANLGDGKNTVILSVTDAAGNTTDSAPIIFSVDKNSNITVSKDPAAGADFATIQAAIDVATSGDTISVAAEAYNESLVIPAGKTGLKIYGAGKVTTSITAFSGDVLTIGSTNNGTEIKGFTINVNGKYYGIKSSGATGVIVEGNDIGGYARNGIIVYGGSITIKDNNITGNLSTSFSVDSIYTRDGVTATITGNELSGNQFDNLYGAAGNGSAAGISVHAGDQVTATYNLIHDNTVGIHAKNGSHVVANENQIYSNTVGFLYEEEGDATSGTTLNAEKNWWGSARRSQIKGMVLKGVTVNNITGDLVQTDSVDFIPWYLSESTDTTGHLNGLLSSTDSAGPVINLETSDADGFVKGGSKVTITATVTDANELEAAPTITITNGKVATTESNTTTLSAAMIASAETNKWTYEWTVPTGMEVIASATVSASDIIGNQTTSSAANFTMDNTVPTIDGSNLITEPQAGKVYKTTVPLKFTPNDTNAVTCSYKIGTGSAVNVPCTKGTPVDTSISGLVDGSYSLVVTVADSAGNYIDSGAISFIVDTDDTLTVGSGKEFATIGAAIAAATAGDTISVDTGTYGERITIPADKAGLQIIGHGKADTVINAPVGSAEANQRVVDIKASVTIQGFTINCNGQDYGIASSGIADINILDNAISGYYKNGIYAVGGEIEIHGNTITGSPAMTGFSEDAIYTRGVTLVIEENTLIGNVHNSTTSTASGISLHTGDSATIRYNKIYNNSFGIHAKNGTTVTAVENQIYSNSYKNFYFEDEDADSVDETFSLINNWWGSKVKSDIESKIAGTALFAPWYLSGSVDSVTGHLNGVLSSTDTTKPTVILSHTIGGVASDRTVVKAGEAVVITATFTEASGIDETSGIAPKITIGTAAPVDMTKVNNLSWTSPMTVPSGDATMAVSVLAYDIIGNENSAATGSTSFTIDNTAPTAYTASIDQEHINNANDEALSFTFAGAEVGASYNYTITDSAEASGSKSGSGTIASETDQITDIDVSALADGVLTLSVTLTDVAGNAGAAASGTIAKDTKAPVLTEGISVATPGKINTPAYVFSSDEAGTISYTGSCVSTDIFAEAADNSITFDVLADGTYSGCKIQVTDAAGNISNELGITEFMIDTTAPSLANMTPGDKATTVSGTPTISAQFTEAGSGVLESSIIFQLTGDSFADALATKNAAGINYIPVNPLDNGTYQATVTASDVLGNSATTSWIFIVKKAISDVSVSSDKETLPADGSSAALVTATVLDDGRYVQGATVTFATTIGSFSDITTTNAQGQATAMLKSDRAGSTTITATYTSGSGIVRGTHEIEFTQFTSDTDNPTISSWTPANGATGVAADANVILTFSEKIRSSNNSPVSDKFKIKYYTCPGTGSCEVPVDVEYDGDRTITINPKSNLLNNTVYYIHIVDTLEDLSDNPFGNGWQSDDKDNHKFTVSLQASASVALNQGWNLISLPLIPSDPGIEVVLAGIMQNVESVWYYLPEGDGWKIYSTVNGVSDTLSTMEDGKGYWIKMTAPATLTITGSEMPAERADIPPMIPTYYMYGEKWNMLGFKSTEKMLPKDYIVDMGANDVLYGYRNGQLHSLTGDDMMDPGYGYWFYTYSDGFSVIPTK
jgi:hypothetical protein